MRCVRKDQRGGDEADGRSRVMRWCFGKWVSSMVMTVYVLVVLVTVFCGLAWTGGEAKLGIWTCTYLLVSFTSEMCFLVVRYGCWRP